MPILPESVKLDSKLAILLLMRIPLRPPSVYATCTVFAESAAYNIESAYGVSPLMSLRCTPGVDLQPAAINNSSTVAAIAVNIAAFLV